MTTPDWIDALELPEPWIHDGCGLTSDTEYYDHYQMREFARKAVAEAHTELLARLDAALAAITPNHFADAGKPVQPLAGVEAIKLQLMELVDTHSNASDNVVQMLGANAGMNEENTYWIEMKRARAAIESALIAALSTHAAPAVPPANVLKFARAMKANEYRGSLFFAKTIIDWVADHAAKPPAPTPKEQTE